MDDNRCLWCGELSCMNITCLRELEFQIPYRIKADSDEQEEKYQKMSREVFLFTKR